MTCSRARHDCETRSEAHLPHCRGRRISRSFFDRGRGLRPKEGFAAPDPSPLGVCLLVPKLAGERGEDLPRLDERATGQTGRPRQVVRDGTGPHRGARRAVRRLELPSQDLSYGHRGYAIVDLLSAKSLMAGRPPLGTFH